MNHVQYHLSQHCRIAQAANEKDSHELRRLIAQSKLRLCLMSYDELKELSVSLSSEKNPGEDVYESLVQTVMDDIKSASTWVPFISRQPTDTYHSN